MDHEIPFNLIFVSSSPRRLAVHQLDGMRAIPSKYAYDSDGHVEISVSALHMLGHKPSSRQSIDAGVQEFRS